MINEAGALTDQVKLIPTDQTQLLDERIQGLEWAPALPIHAQGFSQAPSIESVGFVGRGHLALTISFGRARIDRINSDTALQQLLDSSSLVGLDSYSQARIIAHAFAPAIPAFERMLELKFGNDAGLAIDNDNLVMVFCPIKAQVVSNFIPVFHRRFLPPPKCPVTSHTDTKALVGRSSLRLLDRTPRFRRFSPVNPRGVGAERPWGIVGHAADDSFRRPQIIVDIRRL